MKGVGNILSPITLFGVANSMRTRSKLGLLLIVIGLAVYAVPVVRYGYPTYTPLRSSFRTDPGVVLRQDFTVRTAEAYSLDLGCRDVGPLDYSLPDFLSSGPSQPRIPCDISIRLSRRGMVIQSEHLDELRPASYCNGTGFWHLAYLRLPSAGQYTLEITNRSDLSSLESTDPVVTMDIGGAFYANSIYSRLFGIIIGAPTGLLGVVLFFLGLKHAKLAEEGAALNGGSHGGLAIGELNRSASMLSKISIGIVATIALGLCFRSMRDVLHNTAVRNPQPSSAILWMLVALIVVAGALALIRSSQKAIVASFVASGLGILFSLILGCV